jgi:hypothetical protein
MNRSAWIRPRVHGIRKNLRGYEQNETQAEFDAPNDHRDSLNRQSSPNRNVILTDQIFSMKLYIYKKFCICVNRIVTKASVSNFKKIEFRYILKGFDPFEFKWFFDK